MKSWLSSPLTINYLLSLCKNGPLYEKKYLQIYKNLTIKEEYMTKNKLFILPSYNKEEHYETSNISIENIEFGESKNATRCIMKWFTQYGCFNQLDIEKYISASTASLLCNISVFKGVWKCNQSSPLMKVHNSFSYTEDIKYEARLIELPMQDDDFKLVIVVPNEVSSITQLFNKLVSEGMTAAVSCVQPLFTFSTILEAPSIEFSSADDTSVSVSNCDIFNRQLGNVQINENGTNISILTLLSSTNKSPSVSINEDSLESEAPFYFVVLYKDTAVFTGRYVKCVK